MKGKASPKNPADYVRPGGPHKAQPAPQTAKPMKVRKQKNPQGRDIGRMIG